MDTSVPLLSHTNITSICQCIAVVSLKVWHSGHWVQVERQTMVLSHDYLASAGQEVESRWWREHTAGGSKHWLAELKDKVWGTKTIPVLHSFFQMQFFSSWLVVFAMAGTLDLGFSWYMAQKKVLVAYAVWCFAFQSTLCSSPTWVFPTFDQRHLTLLLLQYSPPALVPSRFPLGEFHFAWRAGSADEAAAVLWHISAWCD